MKSTFIKCILKITFGLFLIVIGNFFFIMCHYPVVKNIIDPDWDPNGMGYMRLFFYSSIPIIIIGVLIVIIAIIQCKSQKNIIIVKD